MLNSILNPNLPLGEAVYDPEEQVEEVDVEEDTKEILEAEKDAVQAAEKGDLRGALTLFDKVNPFNKQDPNDMFSPSWSNSTRDVHRPTTTEPRHSDWWVGMTPP